MSRRRFAKVLAKEGLSHTIFARSKPLKYLMWKDFAEVRSSAYLRVSHSSRWIPVPHFRMGLLDGLTPVFCSSQPHRPDAAQGAAAALATYIREGCGGPAVSHAEPRQLLLFGGIAD